MHAQRYEKHQTDDIISDDDTTCTQDSEHQMNETTCMHKDTRSIAWGRGVPQEAYRLPEGALKGSKDSNGSNEPKVEVQEGL